MLNIQICGETQQQYLQKKSFEHKTSFSVPPGRYLKRKVQSKSPDSVIVIYYLLDTRSHINVSWRRHVCLKNCKDNMMNN